MHDDAADVEMVTSTRTSFEISNAYAIPLLPIVSQRGSGLVGQKARSHVKPWSKVSKKQWEGEM
ncbi:hypothetical protein BTUL_0019g00870 [Botrytis tulipae]|uniref:Uncharacterized protein n=1 Tax=Botrytis tulipae TaxID=87230 RepID=A0A4Z1EYF3_9HELO|nr:hypothetical protein BTUL_0019g00870 [Botrytis tulipae]